MALASGEGSSNIGGGSRKGSRRRPSSPSYSKSRLNSSSNYSGDLAPKGPTRSSASPVRPVSKTYVPYTTAMRPNTSTTRTSIRIAERGGPTSTFKPVKSRLSKDAVAPFWRPSYLKPGPELRNTLTQLVSNVSSDEEGVRMIGYLLDERYRDYKDKLDRKFDSRLNDYEVDLERAEQLARDGKDYVLPQAPAIQGLKPGLGPDALREMMSNALAVPMSEDDREMIERFFRYEMDRVQGLRDLAVGARNSRDTLLDNFQTDLEKARLSDDSDSDKDDIGRQITRGQRPVGKGDFDPDAPLAWLLDPQKNAPGIISEGTKGLLGGLFDPVQQGPIRRFVPDSLEWVLKQAVDESADPLYNAIDQMTRPISGLNSANKALFAQNENPDGLDYKNLSVPNGLHAFSSLWGEDVEEAIASSDGDTLKEITNAAAKGFMFDRDTREGLTLGHDVVKFNADRDNVKNMYDKEGWQLGLGLTGDLLFDPLNFVGVGIVTKPVRAGKAVKESVDTARRMGDLAADVEKVAKQNDVKLSAAEAYNLLTGRNAGKLPRGAAERKQWMLTANEGIDTIVKRLNAGEKVGSEEVATATRARWAALTKEFEDAGVSRGVQDALEIASKKGNIAPEAVQKFNESLTVERLYGPLMRASITQRQVDKLIEGSSFGIKSGRKTFEEVVPSGNKVGVAKIDRPDDAGNVGDIITRQSRPVKNEDLIDQVGATTKQRRGENIRVDDTKVIETQKGPWVSAYDQLNEVLPRTTGPLKERMEKVLTQADEKFTGNKLEDLIPELALDPRISKDFLRTAVGKSYVEAKNHPTRGGTFRELQQKATSLSTEIKRLEAQMTKADGSQLRSLQGKIQQLKTVRNKTNAQKMRYQADAFIQLLEAEVTGGKAALISNQKRYDELKQLEQNLLEEIVAKSGNGVDVKTTSRGPVVNRDYNSFYPEGFAESADPTIHAINQLDRSTPDSISGAQTPARELDVSGTENGWKSVDVEGEFAAAAAAKGSVPIAKYGPDSKRDPNVGLADNTTDVQQLENQLREVRDELRSLKGAEGFQKKNVSKPPALVGDLTVDRLKQITTFDNKNLKFILRPSGDAQVDEWMDNVINVMNRTRDAVFKQNYDTKARRLREQFKGKPKQYENARLKLQNEAASKAMEAAYKTPVDLVQSGKLETDDFSRTFKFQDPNAPATVLELNAAAKNAFGVDTTGYRLFDTAIKEQQKLAKDSVKVLEKRMKEEVLLRIAALQAEPTNKQLSLRVLGNDLALPGSQAFFKAAEQSMGIPVIKQIRQIWSDMFTSPASRLSDDAQLVRARAMSHAPNIIEYHIKALRDTLGQIPKHERESSFTALRKGTGSPVGESATYDVIRNTFGELIPYFNNQRRIDGRALTTDMINRFLPKEYKLSGAYVSKNSIDTPEQLMRAITQGKDFNVHKSKSFKDPFEIAHHLRVGVEQAMTRLTLEQTLNRSFGVKRALGSPTEVGKTIEQFKRMGWETIEELGNTHYFAPEVVKDVRSLLRMMEPGSINQFGLVMDRATGYWKTATTVYNPGYWTRNGIGEAMSSWLAGVNSATPYARSMDVIKYARGDGKELDALLSHTPMKDYVPSESVPGSKNVIKSDNFEVNAEQAWVLYNDQGLKTGFINTEFRDEFSRMGDKLRSYEPTQKAANINQKVRGAGEWYEDYFRMAHFIDAMNKSKAKTPEAAAREAAKEVRKYHFDYTDVTQFEKAVMLRAFPFYKWTRKALPLMVGMMFTKPGKVMAYPKIMNSVSLGLTSDDIAGDNNGYAPNFEGMVPAWAQDLWAYKIAEGSDYDTFFNLSTPQMDSYKAAQDPGSTAYALMNPLLRAPMEQALGTTVGTKFNMTGEGAFDREVESGDERLDHLMRQFPQGNYLAKMRGDDDTASTPDHASFWSGLGFYDPVVYPEKGKEPEPSSFGSNLLGGLLGGSNNSGAAAVGHQRPAQKSKRSRVTQQKREQAESFLGELKAQAAASKPQSNKPFLTGLSDMGNPLPNMTSAELNDPDFGPRTHPVHGGYSNHTGMDFSRPGGEPILASANGVVAYTVDNDSVYGNQVILAHGRKKETMYAHMNNYIVKPGQKVKKGDIIGYVGTTGLSTGDHLHFETWVGGNPVDPITFLGGE